MRWFSGYPIRQKLLLIILWTNLVALLLMMAGIMVYEIGTYRGRLERELADQASFITSNSAPALAFDDRDTANQILATLRGSPEIAVAGLYNRNGKLFSSYVRDQRRVLPPSLKPGPERLRFAGGQVELVRPVMQKGRRLGTLFINADMATVEERLMPYGGIVLLVLLAIGGGTLLLQALLRRLISEPLLRLAGMAERLASGDLEARVPLDSTDEIGQLAKTFNRMAGELAQSRAWLEESREKLEIRVMERTRELQQAHDRLAQEMKEREKTEEQLRQAQKMEAVGVLAGGIAHDFNNVLAAILGNAELALDETLPSPVRQNLQQILKASMRARDLVRQILAFSRKTDRGRSPFKLAPLLTETYDLLRGTLLPTVRMQLDTASGPDVVVGNPSQIQQVLMNLATNAAYAMRENGGLLTISASQVTVGRKGEIPGTELSPGSYIRLTVRDTGTGIPEDVRRRIFEPFFTTKGPGQGTGMGLAVVYGIVKNHGGDLTVESRLGEGSAFNIFLPSSTEEIEAAGVGESDVPGGSERVLLVDDEPAVAQMMSRVLDRLGYKVTTTQSGTEAWDIFQAAPDAFDLVVTDQVMPDLTGVELAKRILAVKPGLPIILFTGYSEAISPEDARAAGIAEFVMKPVVKREAAETIRRVLDGKGGMRD